MTRPGEQNSPQETGERLIDSLAQSDVEYVFATFGTDHPPLIKGLQQIDDLTTLLAPDEMVAASAAHGYAHVTGTPQAVLVHVDVGTANLGPSLHNAARSRIPMFVMAGRTPLTTRGEQPGTRSIFVHYYQDVYDQHGLVREYTKWDYELETGANVERVFTRGLDMAAADPPGPVYLTLPREILRSEASPEGNHASSPPFQPNATRSDTTTIAEELQTELVDAIMEASHPLVITSWYGRDPTAVPILERFAETAGVPVVEAAPAFDMNFPRDHPLHLGFTSEPYLDDADLIFVIACDVPWVPSQATPNDDTTIVQIDPDPTKEQYPLWDFPADIAIDARPASVVADLADAIDERNTSLADRSDRFREIASERRTTWQSGVPDVDAADGITPGVLSETLGTVLEPDDVVVDETVTNTVAVLRHVTRTEPGTYYSYCSSGLGWATGAAAGVKLARPNDRVVSLIGDGSFVLGNPVAALQMAHAYDLPHLIVIYNNRGWQAVTDAIHDQYGPDAVEDEPFTRFDPGFDFAAMADGMGYHAERVVNPATLASAIERGLAAVDDGTIALLDVHLQEGE